MGKPKKSKAIGERGTSHLAETVKRLEKRVAALERARKREETWPEIIPLDDEAREIYGRGMAELRAGHVTPVFSSIEEMHAYFNKNSS
jgi:predicted nucleic acid-binding protein